MKHTSDKSPVPRRAWFSASRIAIVCLISLSMLNAACGEKDKRATPPSGDAYPKPTFRLDDWCKSQQITEEAKKTLDAMILSLGADNCFEFDYRYARLARRKLVITFKELSDPAPILALSDLQELSIRGNQFKSLNWTRELIQLSVLDAAQNPLGTESDAPLSSGAIAPNLTELILDNTGIKSVGLSGSQLKVLSLAGNNISDTSFVSGGSQLTTLILDQNNIATLENFPALTRIKTLSLSKNPLAGLDLLSRLTTLRELALNDVGQHLKLSTSWLPVGIETLRAEFLPTGGGTAELSSIEQYVKLRTLHLNGREISGTFEKHRGLTDLSVEGGKLAEVEILQQFPKLQSLNIRAAGITVLPDLSKASGLTSIIADRNDLAELDGVRLPESLRTLSLEGCRVAAMRHTDHLKFLTNLQLKGNYIQSIEGFSWPPELKSLDLSQNEIDRLQSLEGLNTLTMLQMARNRITNPAPLASLINLEWLDLSGNQLSTVAPLAPLTKLNLLDIRSNGLASSSLCPLINLTACLF